MRGTLLLIVLAYLTAAHLAHAETVRTVDYGMFVHGVATPDEQDGEGYRRDVYRLHGHAGDHVHAAVIAPFAGNVLVEASRANQASDLEYDGSITDPAGRGEAWTTNEHTTNRFSADFTLPDDGDYDISVTIMRNGITEASPPIRYLFAVDREPVVHRAEWLTDHGGLGWRFYTQIGVQTGMVSFSTRTNFQIGFSLSLGPGYQFGEKLGVDLLACTSIALNPSPGEVGDDALVLLSTLVGPRLRHGNKYDGFTGLSAGLAYALVLSGLPMNAEDADPIGVGARFEHVFAVAHNSNPDWTTGFTIALQGEWNGPVSIYSAGLAASF